MGFFDWVGDTWSRAGTAAHNTGEWIADGFAHPGEALKVAGQRVMNIPSWYEAQNHGFSSVEAYQDYLRQNPDKDPYRNNGYYGTGNETADGILNTIGGVGVGVSNNGGVHPGMGAPVNALAPRDINGQVDAAVANPTGVTLPSMGMPANPSDANIGNNSYDYRTEPTNQIGEQRIDLVHPESTVRPDSLGLSPIDVGQPGTDSYANGMQDARPLPDSSNGGAAGSGNTSGGSSSGPPLVTPDAADPAAPNAQTGGGEYFGPALSLLGAGAGALVNLKNGADLAQAQKDAAAAQAQGYKDALAQNQAQFDKTQENIKPWLDAGSAALPKLASFDTEHPRGNFQESPDYAWRLSEGLKALRNTTGGGLVSGATMKAMNDYAGGSASQEYGNWYNRQENSRNTDRGALQSLAGLGQSAMGQSNAAIQNFGANQSANTIGMANAMAGGNVGAANATASGYQSGAQTLMGGINSAIQMYQGDQQYKNLLAMINRNKTS